MKRKLKWREIKKFNNLFLVFIASVGGVGFFPQAPGTLGAAVGALLGWKLQEFSNPIKCAFLFIFILLGIKSAKKFDQINKSKDHPSIVIDELIGMIIASWNCKKDVISWVIAFLLFRFFDIFKFFPVKFLEDWSKKQKSSWVQAWGVIADDCAAGLQGLCVFLFLQFFKLLP